MPEELDEVVTNQETSAEETVSTNVIQDEARTGSVEKFSELLQEYGAAEVEKSDLTGRDFLKEAIEGMDVEAKEEKLKALKAYDAENGIKDPSVDEALAVLAQEAEEQNEIAKQVSSDTTKAEFQEILKKALEAQKRSLSKEFNAALEKKDKALRDDLQAVVEAQKEEMGEQIRGLTEVVSALTSMLQEDAAQQEQKKAAQKKAPRSSLNSL